MKLFGQVMQTRPGWNEPYSGYPWRGIIYNEYGQIVTSEVGGMTEETCRSAINTVAQQIYQDRIFEIPEEKN